MKYFILVLFLLLLMPESFAMDSILVLNSSEKHHYDQTVSGINDEAEDRFSIKTIVMNDSFSQTVFKSALKEANPDYIILIGNDAALFYYRYSASSDKAKIPSIIVSSIFSDHLVNKMTHTLSVRYEIPLPIIVSQLRYHLDRPIRNVGVMYRSWMSEFIEHSKVLGDLEEVNLIKYPISDKATPRSVAHNFKQMINDDRVDAVWFLHDDYFILKRNLKALKPLLDKNKLPIFTNIDSLVTKNMGVGMFAVTSDQYGLGVQAVREINKIYKQHLKENKSIAEIMNEREKNKNLKLIEPISTKTTLNKYLLNRKSIASYHLLEIDQILE